jgi:phosphoribosyl 1,2-cyclic phosphodiesterase
LQITFYGVRGSCPCPSPQNQRYGGNTACTVLEMPGQPPIILDLGTGLRRYGERQPADGSFAGAALVTHLHWDHVQGLPFFPPIDREGALLDVYGPVQDEGTLGSVFGDLMRPPYFPVHFTELRGRIEFHDVDKDDLVIGAAKVKVRSVPHCGPTVGYRIEWGGVIVAYVSDHQAPYGLDSVADSVLELCEGADLLIHDAQYTPAEFEQKAHWGHCTVDYAVRVAKQAGVKTLSLFHHDPAHDDDTMDGLLAGAKATSARLGGAVVLAATDGLTIKL